MAQVMDKVALVRSGSHNNDHHETATNWVLSGRFGSPFGDYPAIGAVVAHELGFTGVLPPYMAVPRNPSFTWELGKSAFLGGRYESFKSGDPNDANFRVRDIAPSETLPQKRIERRQSLLAAVDGLAREVHGSDQIATYDEFHEPGRVDDPLARIAAGLCDRKGGRRAPRSLRPYHIRPKLPVGAAARRARRAVRDDQRRRLGPSCQDLGKGSRSGCRSSTTASPR